MLVRVELNNLAIVAVAQIMVYLLHHATVCLDPNCFHAGRTIKIDAKLK